MALYDRADLVDRFRRLVKRPATDQSLDVDDIYRYLSDGQEYVMRQLAIHVPAANRPVKELMTTSDSGLTYTISTEPLGKVDIYSNIHAHYPLTPGEAWNHNADFEWEGLTTIRMMANRARTFSNGPYAHYVPRPAAISATQEPTLVPEHTRLLAVYAAATQYANEGGLMDPTPFESLYQNLWSGDPNKPGDIGILGELRLRYGTGERSTRPWWHSPDLSDLPIGFNS